MLFGARPVVRARRTSVNSLRVGPVPNRIETGFYPAWEQETSLHRLNECNPYKPTRSDFSK